MNSNVLLNIIDSEIKTEYIVKRNQDIKGVSITILIFRIFTTIVIAIITAFEDKPAYFVQLWLPRIIAIILHAILLIVTAKVPTSNFLLNIHGPVVMISQLSGLLWYTGEKIKDLPLAMTTSISSLFFMLISSYIMNGGWIITTAAMIFQTTSVLAFYAYMY